MLPAFVHRAYPGLLALLVGSGVVTAMRLAQPVPIAVRIPAEPSPSPPAPVRPSPPAPVAPTEIAVLPPVPPEPTHVAQEPAPRLTPIEVRFLRVEGRETRDGHPTRERCGDEITFGILRFDGTGDPFVLESMEEDSAAIRNM